MDRIPEEYMNIIYKAQVDKVEEAEPEVDEDEVARKLHPAKHQRVERNEVGRGVETKHDSDGGEAGPGGEEGNEEEGERKVEGPSPMEVAKSLGLPVSHEAELESHTKGVNAIAFEPKGIRMVTGGVDYAMKMFDFNGMDNKFRSFRSMSPSEGYAIRSLSFSPTGSHFVVATASPKPQIFDRDGFLTMTFMRGDMYIRDPVNTTGHGTEVSQAVWHPTSKEHVLTCGIDGTLRIWNINGKRHFDELKNEAAMKLRSERNLKISATACCYAPDGKRVYGAGIDGSIQMWVLRNTVKLKFARPDAVVRDAHAWGRITSMAVSPNGKVLATRGSDHTLKLWKAKKPSQPLCVISGLPNLHETTNIVFSPDGKLVATGISRVPPKPKGQTDQLPAELSEDADEFASMQQDAATGALEADENEGGRVYFFSVKDCKKNPGMTANDAAFVATICPGHSVVSLAWNSDINQIAVGCSDGSTRVLYDLNLSKRGAMVAAARAPKVRKAMDYVPDSVFAPDRRDRIRLVPERKRRAQIRKDPVLTRRPDLPTTSKQQTIGMAYTQFVKHKAGGLDFSLLSNDPRAEIVKYAEKAEKNPLFVQSAYQGTQPKALLADKTLEAEAEEQDKSKSKKQRQAAEPLHRPQQAIKSASYTFTPASAPECALNAKRVLNVVVNEGTWTLCMATADYHTPY